MQFGSMLVYCTVYEMCVCGGPTSIFFQGAPNPLATALHTGYFEGIVTQTLASYVITSVQIIFLGNAFSLCFPGHCN